MEIIKPTRYVKANVNVKQGDIVELLNEGSWEALIDKAGKSKQVLKFEVKLSNGEVKEYTMNNTTIDNMTFAYGKDSRQWVDKPLKVWIEMTRAFGQPTPMLILTPVEWPTSMPPTEALPTINQ